MAASQELASMINDACTSVIVLILNGIFNVCHEIFKFSLILFLVYYMGMWIFRFWDAVLDGTLPTVSHSSPPIETPDPHRNLIEKYELEEEVNDIESDFENFIKAELRDSNLSVGIKPRSSQFEHHAIASKSKAENHQFDGKVTQEIANNPELNAVTSQTSLKESHNVPKSLSVPIHPNPDSAALDLNVPNRSDYSFDAAVKLRRETDTKGIQSYDDQTNHESFHRV